MDDVEKFVDDLYKSLPPEAHKMLKEIMREKAYAEKDPELMKTIEIADDIERLNNQLVSTIGLMKHLLKNFDETNNNPARALENLHFYKRYAALIEIPLHNLDAMLGEFNEKWCSK